MVQGTAFGNGFASIYIYTFFLSAAPFLPPSLLPSLCLSRFLFSMSSFFSSISLSLSLSRYLFLSVSVSLSRCTLPASLSPALFLSIPSIHLSIYIFSCFLFYVVFHLLHSLPFLFPRLCCYKSICPSLSLFFLLSPSLLKFFVGKLESWQ